MVVSEMEQLRQRPTSNTHMGATGICMIVGRVDIRIVRRTQYFLRQRSRQVLTGN